MYLLAASLATPPDGQHDFAQHPYAHHADAVDAAANGAVGAVIVRAGTGFGDITADHDAGDVDEDVVVDHHVGSPVVPWK